MFLPIISKESLRLVLLDVIVELGKLLIKVPDDLVVLVYFLIILLERIRGMEDLHGVLIGLSRGVLRMS